MIALSNSRARAYRSLGISLSNSRPESHGQVCLANDTMIGQSTYIEEITSFGIGYGSMQGNKLRELLDFLAPKRTSTSRLIRLTQYDETEPWVTVDYKKVKRSPLADFAQIRQRTATKIDKQIFNRGLTVRLDRDQLKDKPMWQQMHTQWLIDLLQRASVLEAIDIIKAGAVNDAAQWDAGSDPDMDVRTRMLALADVTGFYPRRALLGDSATLARQKSYRSQLNAGSLASATIITDDQIATTWGLDAVKTNAERYQASAAAKTEIVGKNVLIYTSVDGESPEDPSNIVRHVASASYGGGEYAVYVTDEGVKTVYLTVENYELVSTQHTTGMMNLAVN